MATPIYSSGTYSLTGDLYLANDINVSGGDALTFTAPGVRLNLNGKTIRNIAPHPTNLSRGIVGLAAYNLAAFGGSITGFRFGVDSETPWTRLERVDLSGNLYIAANLKGHTSRVLSCTISNIGGVTDELYAVGVNMLGSNSFVSGNVMEEIYAQAAANQSGVGEGVPIIINGSAENCSVTRNHLKNSVTKQKTIGIFAGGGGAQIAEDNTVVNFWRGIQGGGGASTPLTAKDNVVWMKSPLTGSVGYSVDHGSVTGSAILGYETAINGTVSNSGNITTQ